MLLLPFRFALMQKCWSFTPDDRPCFSDLLQQLEEYRDQCDEMSAAEIALLSPTGAEGIFVTQFCWLLVGTLLYPSQNECGIAASNFIRSKIRVVRIFIRRIIFP